MARIRTIKPEFWLNETIAAIPEHARLLAIALLNYADDRGYFLANPALVRAACFPFEEHSKNVLGSLQELSRIGYIEVRECGGKSIGRICKFSDHQRIDKPQKSKLEAAFGEFPNENSDSKNVPGTFQESSKNVPRLDLGTGNREQGKGTGEEEGEEEGEKTAADAGPSLFQEVIDYWNEKRSQNCRMTDGRRKALATRWKDRWWRSNWRMAIDRCCETEFCNGRNDRGWVADLDWFLKPESATRLIEGKYANGKPITEEIPF